MTIPSLTGQLLVKGTPDYEASRCRNFAVNAHARGYQPQYIAVCESVEDVQKCVQLAAAQNLTITVRTGGHNWFGCYLRDNVFLIDVGKLNQLEIHSNNTATVGPAVVGHELNEVAAKRGLCFSAGHCVGVPLGGFLLGGGLGWFQPYYGYAAEYVLEVTLVDAQGEVKTVSDGDWMWMARGSASAFPGVVVEFKIKLSPLPAVVRCKTDMFPVEHHANLVEFLDGYMTKTPQPKLELTVSLASTPPPLAEVVNAPKVMMVIQTWQADSEDEFQKLVASIDKFPVPPVVPGEFQDYSFSGLSGMLAPAFPPGQQWIGRALMYDQSPTSIAIDWKDVQHRFSEHAPLGLSHAMMVWGPERRVTQPGCYGDYSGKGFVMLVLGAHSLDESPKATQHYVDVMMEAVEPHVWKYDPLEHPLHKGTFAKTFTDGVAEKLTEVRSKLDPNGRFFDPTTADPSH